MASRDNIPPSYPCDAHDHRLQALEKRADDHSSRIGKAEVALADGRVEFAEIRKDLAAIQTALSEIKITLANKPSDWQQKAVDALIFWSIPMIGSGILYSIVKSGQVHGVPS